MTVQQHRWILSGGIASGKSKVRELLAAAGVTTVDADSIGHSVLTAGGPAFAEVAGKWPNVVRDGEIDRASLAEVVFNDPDELLALEKITHPYIMGAIRAQVADIDGPVVVEIPILSHGLDGEWKTVVVDCHDEIRLQRAVARGMREEDALSRMAIQPSRAEWLAVADFVIPNSGGLDALSHTLGLVVPMLGKG